MARKELVPPPPAKVPPSLTFMASPPRLPRSERHDETVRNAQPPSPPIGAPQGGELTEQLTSLTLQDVPQTLSTLDKDAAMPTSIAARPQGPSTPARGYSKPILPHHQQQSQTPSQASSSTSSSASATARLLNHFLPTSRHNDLTPVMRNSTRHGTEYLSVSQASVVSSASTMRDRQRQANANMISPDDKSDDALHGEAFLSCFGSRQGPSIPLMKSHSRLQESPDRRHSNTPEPALASRRHYSLTHLAQYEDEQSPVDEMDQGTAKQRTPYQPSRPDMLDDVLTLSKQQDLGTIFIPRRTVSVDKQHRFDLLGAHDDNEPVPALLERQESIPSIHMAHNFEHGSVTTCGDYDDDDLDDDSIIKCSFDDDSSWSSRGSKSSLYMDETDAGVALMPVDPNHRVVCIPARATFIPRELRMDTIHSNSVCTDDDDNGIDVVIDNDRRSRRRKRKQDRAYEWLQSVEASPSDLAEAASSKFLMTTEQQQQQLHQAYSLPALNIACANVNNNSMMTPTANIASPTESPACVTVPSIRPRQFCERRQSSPATIFQGDGSK